MSANDIIKYIAERAYVNVASVSGINRVQCQSSYGTIGIVASSYCRPLLRKPGFGDAEVDGLLGMFCCD